MAIWSDSPISLELGFSVGLPSLGFMNGWVDSATELSLSEAVKHFSANLENNFEFFHIVQLSGCRRG